ncbi:AAA family ATPase [Actinoplanes subtropicus]|uniref:sensor histidine kinase n=1 Tax=Actinoplanes subtropicus TaxID=543632 RepID=UPI000691766A|nr:AAA family ATPase [Actinoplanes subtropicus]
MGEELLYRSERTQVSRQPGAVVGKRAFGPGAIRRLEHERSILRHLAGIPGVPVLTAQQPRQVLTTRDDGGRPSTGFPLPLRRLIDIARALTTTLAAVHRAGVLHRDITPDNVLLTADGTPLLIDYDLALRVPAAQPEAEPIGTLGYLPPEQTGRLRLPIDRRADLYGLGATLYALATGHPPFPGDDPLELIRDTLVRIPPAPGDLPPGLAAIVMRLLEKDPDHRYQSAEAVAHDLDHFEDAAGWRLGERDFPAVLTGPSELVGRGAETRRLTAALDRARDGGGPAVLISGPPGVGKSALATALRAEVTARGGWFVTGKYDQFRTGTGSGGIRRALTHLAGQLLAEPAPEMAAHRQRLEAALGPNAATIAAAIPEMATLLGPRDESVSDDPGTATGRLIAAIAAMVRAVAARYPLVVVLDDLQWASSASLRILDGVLSAGPAPGLLIVGIYRDQEVDAGHPLAPLAARWERDGEIEAPIRLGGLAEDGLAELLGTVLRIEPAAAAGLAGFIGAASAGNPYASMELLNALRAEGRLELAEDGWRWDDEAVRDFVARHGVPELLAARIDRLPEPARLALTALACLGGDTRPAVLATGLHLPEQSVVEHLAPAAAARMIIMDPAGTVRFRHDLILRAARDSAADERDRLQLDLARRLAARDDSRQEAAEQYLAVADKLEEPREQRVAALLLHEAGRRAAELTNHPVAEELMSCADRLAAAGVADTAARNAIAVDRHATLYCLGRLADADDVYRELIGRSPDVLTLAGATAVQINSLAQRGANAVAIDLGLGVLRRLGLVPPRDLARFVATRLDGLYRWVLAPAGEEAEVTDPRIVAAGRLIYRLLPPAFQRDALLHAWLVLEARELWMRHGVCAPFVGTVAGAVAVTIDQRDDYRTGYLLTRRVVEAGRERGYLAETAVAQFMHLCLGAHWFEPLEEVAEATQQVRDDLVSAGDVQVVGLLSMRLVGMLLDCLDSLEAVADELDGYLAFAERTGSRYSTVMLISYRQLIDVLRGRPPRIEEDELRAAIGPTPTGLATHHANRALAALILGDDRALDEHSAAAMDGVRSIRGFPVSAVARLCRALCLARRPRAGGPAMAGEWAGGPAAAGELTGGPAVAGELADIRDWLARRAAEAPRNLRPLLRLVDAERAWALGDAAAAARQFDAGLDEVAGRPWHHALLAERAGLFHLAEGLEHAGRRLLAEARDAYRAWGADGKVTALEAEHPFLRATVAAAPAGDPGGHRIDLMAILRASQALSSETTVAGLQARVGDLLSAMTGATDVHLVLQNQETSHWYAARGGHTAPVADPEAGPEAADPPGDLPVSAIRYVLRTGEPLLVGDATRDDRFARDPYLAGLDACALLVVPVPSHNVSRAVLVLENRRQRDVFSTDRLETVRLIAGQLAVTLDNAVLHDSLESAVKARTADLAASNRRLAEAHLELGERNQELEAANQLKSDLIGMLGHEINNPLAMILGYVDLALTEEDVPAPVGELLGNIHRGAKRLDTIVHEVLALVSIDAGRLTALPRPIRVADHIDAALAATGTQGVAVTCPRELVAAMQPGHFDHILTNLISNAAKYAGGATAIVAAPTGDASVTVEVRDEGPGVPPDFRGHLFDRFARAARTAGTVSGTGLGLYIVRELARANGGDVDYRPARSRGSVFVLTLPRPHGETPEMTMAGAPDTVGR